MREGDESIVCRGLRGDPAPGRGEPVGEGAERAPPEDGRREGGVEDASLKLSETRRREDWVAVDADRRGDRPVHGDDRRPDPGAAIPDAALDLARPKDGADDVADAPAAARPTPAAR